MTIEMSWRCYHAKCKCGYEWFEPVGEYGPSDCPNCGKNDLYDLSETRYVDDDVQMLPLKEEEYVE